MRKLAIVTIAMVCGILSSSLAGISMLNLTTQHFSQKIETVNVGDGTLTTPEGNPELPSSFLAALHTPDNHKPINILVIGSDVREGDNSQYGDPAKLSGARSDTTLLVHISGDREHATVVSIPRDLWISIPSCISPSGEQVGNTTEKFNYAYAAGGPECTVRTVTALTNIPINHVVEVDFTGFKDIVNAAGGIPVCLTVPVNDPNAQASLPAGQFTADGEQALSLARARYTLADGSDTSRIERQQKLFRNLITKVKSSDVLLDPKQLYDVVSASLDAVSADTGLSSLPAAVSLLMKVKNVPATNIYFVTVPWTDRNDGSTIAVDTTAARKLFNTIIQDTPPPTATPTTTPTPAPTTPGTPPAATPAPTLPPTGCDNPIL